MDFQIISDSCMDFDDQFSESADETTRVPFTIVVDGEEIADKNLDVASFMPKMKARKEISTACPSPFDFYRAFKKGTVNFIITISSMVSGSFQSAMLAKRMFEGEDKENQAYVIDSKSASAGQNLIVLKLKSLIEQSLDIKYIIRRINIYVNNLHTLFLPVSIDNLERSGRIGRFKAIIGKALHFIPIFGSNKIGQLVLKDWAMREEQAVEKILETISVSTTDLHSNIILAITHVDAREKAEKMRDIIQSRFHFKKVLILRAGGLSTVYADKGGLVFAY